MEQKIDKTKAELNKRLVDQFKNLKDEISIEMQGVKGRMQSMEDTLGKLKSSCVTDFPVETTCVVMGLREEALEGVEQRCGELIHRGLGLKVRPKMYLRLKSYTDRPGLAKIQCNTKADKQAILEAKGQLAKKGSGYEHVFVQSSQTYEEVLICQNTQTLLDILPNGKDYQFTMSGRLIKINESIESWNQKRRNKKNQDGQQGANNNR